MSTSVARELIRATVEPTKGVMLLSFMVQR
jgi:hypothetical protein